MPPRIYDPDSLTHHGKRRVHRSEIGCCAACGRVFPISRGQGQATAHNNGKTVRACSTTCLERLRKDLAP